MSIPDLLLSMGCREWRRSGHHRIYLPSAVAASVLGLEVSLYQSGNISSARLPDARAAGFVEDATTKRRG